MSASPTDGRRKGQGQPYSQFQIEATDSVHPGWAAGSMVSTVPAHLMGQEGGAYCYGSTKVAHHEHDLQRRSSHAIVVTR
jgi:hypothetical protein